VRLGTRASALPRDLQPPAPGTSASPEGELTLSSQASPDAVSLCYAIGGINTVNTGEVRGSEQGFCDTSYSVSGEMQFLEYVRTQYDIIHTATLGTKSNSANVDVTWDDTSTSCTSGEKVYNVLILDFVTPNGAGQESDPTKTETCK